VLRVHREAGIRDEKTFVKGIEGKGELRDINLCRFIVPRLIMLMNRTRSSCTGRVLNRCRRRA